MRYADGIVHNGHPVPKDHALIIFCQHYLPATI